MVVVLPTATPSPNGSLTATFSSTLTPSPCATPTASASPGLTLTWTLTPTYSASPSASATPTQAQTWPATATPACSLPSSPAGVYFVLGQTNLASTGINGPGLNASSMAGPEGLACAGGKFFVADRDNHRVLIWNSPPTSMGQPADLVLGQSGFGSSAFGNAANQMYGPAGVSSDGNRLVVADAFNNRVLIWNSMPQANDTPADVVLGQPGFGVGVSNNGGISARSLSQPFGVLLVNGSLVVSDSSNNRVLVWNSLPQANWAPADLVLGQASFGSASTGNGATMLNRPIALGSDGTRLMVADFFNNRVLVFNSLPSSSGAAADLVLGQPGFNSSANNAGGLSASSLSQPWGMIVSGGSLFVADSGNHRVLAWNSFPGSHGAAADRVIGQANFSSNGVGAGANGLKYPASVIASGDDLFIAEWGNNRVSDYNCNYLPTATPSSTISATFSASPTVSPTLTASPSPTASPTPPALVLVNCASDSVAGWPATGSVSLAPGNSFVPLCDGWIIYEDQTLNQIKTLYVLGGQVGSTYQLTASPDRLAYDAASGILYVSKLSSTILTRLDMQTGIQTNITLAAQVNSMAIGPAGRVFVSTDNWPSSFVQVIDGATGSVDCSANVSVDGGALAYDAVHQELFAAETAGSPGDIVGLHYDPSGPSLVQDQSVTHTFLSFFLEPVAVSPDGKHLSADVEWISDLYYSGWTDFDPQDLGQRRGKWAGVAMAFSPDSQLAAGTDYNNFSISSADRHQILQQSSTSGWGSSVSEVSFSRGGGLAYALETGYSSPAVLHWMRVTAAPAATPTPGTVALADLQCSVDSVGALPASGSFNLSGPATDLIPLCSGMVIVEDQTANSISVLDSSGVVLSTFALPATPLRMALDSAHGWLYVACDSDGELMKLDLVAGSLTKIPLGEPVYSVAVGPGTKAFASLDPDFPRWISILDGGTNAMVVSRTTDTYSAAELHFDGGANNLFLQDASIYLERLAYAPGPQTLTKMEGNFSQPQYAALAPSGLNLAASSSSGGSGSYLDYNALAFGTTYGNFTVPSYRGPCTYSPDGASFLASDDANLYVFASATHAVQKTLALGTSFSDKVNKVRFSRGGELIYGLVQFSGVPYSTVVWGKYP